MSSISLSLKMLFAGSALAGLTLLACGGDDGGGSGNSDDDVKTGSKKDAGTAKKDGGTVKKDAGIASLFPSGAVEGEDCSGLGGLCDDDACDTPPCGAQCVDGVYGECKNGTSFFGGDSGIKIPTSFNTDGGTYSVSDSGNVTVKFGDSSVELPPTECPGGFMCSDIGAAVGIPLKFCAETLLPPSCTTMKDCTDMGFKLATCGAIPLLGGMGCLQSCK